MGDEGGDDVEVLNVGVRVRATARADGSNLLTTLCTYLHQGVDGGDGVRKEAARECSRGEVL